MVVNEIRNLLKQLEDGTTTVDEVLVKLKMEPFEDLDFAKPDFHRQIRQGTPEVIYGAGKTKEQIAAITKSLIDKGQKNVLITRMSEDAAEYLKNELSGRYRCDDDGCFSDNSLFYDKLSRICVVGGFQKPDGKGRIVVVTAGTSDLPVAKEAVYTAKYLGNDVIELFDVGVAGIHRLLENIETIFEARVIIAIAGMEGAIASVVGGLADCPVIAVPTSVGYGASFGGLSALLSMLNSCASGVSVVNIDNGFGAAYQASMINHL
ncbi:nickel pincer cofactor biosynthesis protein LarB [Eubacterium sp. MSJ-13]|uniref:nickel pincer cofactor biosynthesis protein LarB n=1 Tax=Eubacterium sp. MSJ-13 TaxID=2841513 RepID=UPI001C105E2A|nr:nickel pincer cofactor biosynthesis protein LarB [Eubacterium sp. MSJ-13]